MKNAIGSAQNMISTPHDASNEFSVLLVEIMKELRKNEAENLETIKDMCAFLTIKDNPDALLFSEDQQEAINTCKDIKILFKRHLRGCWRYDDFSLLKTIIQYLGSDRCKEMLSQYELKIDCKMKLQDIYEHCKQKNLDIPVGFGHMVAIVSNKIFCRVTKEEYDELKQFIAKYCGVNEYAMYPFNKADESSLLLEWSIPSTAVPYIVEAATRNCFIFILNAFVYLRISSKVILDTRKSENVSTRICCIYISRYTVIRLMLNSIYVHTESLTRVSYLVLITEGTFICDLQVLDIKNSQHDTRVSTFYSINLGLTAVSTSLYLCQ